jgi:pimeloyl-ACP methyl ester carboxylesterase
MHAYSKAPHQCVKAANGIDYRFRVVGGGDGSLLLLQHFRGNLDNWDPALIDGLARGRRVLAFDNTGVGGASGDTPHTVEEMARDALEFVDAVGLDEIDVLGFSLGSFVAQELTLARPDLVRRLVLASPAPRGARGMHGWAAPVIDAVGVPQPTPEGVLSVFYTESDASRAAGTEAFQRMFARQDDRDAPTSWQTRLAQYDAVCSWGIPDHGQLERVTAIEQPVLVANGDSDPMILPRYAHLLAGLLPNARLQIYPDAAHGFLFQHHETFVDDVDALLG